MLTLAKCSPSYPLNYELTRSQHFTLKSCLRVCEREGDPATGELERRDRWNVEASMATVNSPDNTSGLKVTEMNMRMGEANHTNSHSNSDDNECTVREQDRFMPIANVIRIMRKILPPHAKISDDAKETIQECVSEYISFITGEANEHCQREQRKTITAEDVLWAMSKLGFDDYIEPLTVYLHRYRELEGERGSIRGEPVVKRVVDYGTLGVAAFAPAFHMGHHHHHGHGFFGSGAMGGYLKDESSAGSSQAAVANGEPYAQQHK